MSKFWAKVRFKQGRNAVHLIRAFFKDFNPTSSIVIRGREAKMEIVFRQPPMEIINAINHCEVLELNYGKNLKEYEEDEPIQHEVEDCFKQEDEGGESSQQIKQVSTERKDLEQTEPANEKSEDLEQTEPANKEGKDLKQTEPPNEESEDSKQIEQPKKKAADSTSNAESSINVPRLEEIAKKSTSFEDFVKLVAEWLEMDKRQEFFENLAIVSTEVNKIAWKDLEKALKDKGVTYSQWDKAWAVNQVSEKLSVTMLKFLKEIGQYKGYSFEPMEEYSNEENKTEQATEGTTEIEEEAGEFDEGVIAKPRVKMECMPEIKDFEETLASVDKTQPVAERVQYVLEAMGLSEMSKAKQKQIVEIANTAVRNEQMSFDIILLEANIPINQAMEVRRTFSKFLNDFVQKYESSKEVKLLEFLSELQKIIMLDSEIENFSDFIDSNI